jgi:hypothetical protein
MEEKLISEMEAAPEIFDWCFKISYIAIYKNMQNNLLLKCVKLH